MADIDKENPTDSSFVSQYPANERDSRAALEAIIGADHEAGSDTADDGKHKLVQMLAQSAPGGGSSGQGYLYTKDTGSGAIELFFMDENGTEVQITNRGAWFPNVDEKVTASDEDLNRTTQGTADTGDIKPWIFSSAQTGWIFADGRTIGDDLSGADHEGEEFRDLFDLIKAEGAAWGNTGTEVFDDLDTVKLPDFRDRTLIGTATMGSTDAARVDNYSTGLGDTGGEDQHTLTESELASHNHGGSTGNTDVGRVFSGGVSGDSSGDGLAFDKNHNHNHSISSDGGDSPHNNMQPFVAVNWLIKI